MKREQIKSDLISQDLESLKTLIKTHIAALQCDPEILSLFKEKADSDSSKKVTNLNVYARQRLSQENQNLKDIQSLISELLQHNFELQEHLYKSIITLMRCKAVEEADQTLAKTIPPLLQLNHLMIYLEKINLPANFETLKEVPEGFCNKMIGCASSMLGRVTKNCRYLYDQNEALPQSQALIRLHFGNYEGVLVMASPSKDCFSTETGTELLNFFARFIEQYLRPWLP